jgi:hypothetical protein
MQQKANFIKALNLEKQMIGIVLATPFSWKYKLNYIPF